MKSKRMPLYSQVEEYICKLIYANMKKGVASIPSENAIAVQFNISRITSRRAIENLVTKGFLIRKKGSGTYINPDLSPENLRQFEKYDTPVAPAEIYKERRTLAVIVPDLKSRYILNLLDGIQEIATLNNWNIFLSVSKYSQTLEAELIKKSITYSNALIIFPVNKEVYNREIIKLSLQQFPMVVIDNILNGLETSTVTSDNKTAAYKSTKYFISHGRKHIGIISQPFSSAFALKQRYIGYERALQDYGLPLEKRLILDSLEHYGENSSQLIKNYIASNPDLDAIIAFNYELGIKTLKVLTRSSGHPSADDVIIFDEEFSEISEFLKFRINYVRQDAYSIGNIAFQIILDSLNSSAYLTQHRTVSCILGAGGALINC